MPQQFLSDVSASADYSCISCIMVAIGLLLGGLAALLAMIYLVIPFLRMVW